MPSNTPLFHQMESPSLPSFFKNSPHVNYKKKKSTGGLLRVFKALSMLKAGYKYVALLARSHRKPMLTDQATIVTLFGYRKRKLSLAIQDDPHRLPVFVIELPMHTSTFHKEMTWDVLRLVLECDTMAPQRRRLLEELVWAVYCNGRKFGYCIRRKDMNEDEFHVMKLLRGVSMGAGVLPGLDQKLNLQDQDGELIYMRARFQRVVGSKDVESLHMLNPDGSSAQELSIFFLRPH